MKRCELAAYPRLLPPWRVLWGLPILLAVFFCACGQKEVSPARQGAPSTVTVTAGNQGAMTITTRAAEFELLPTGYLRAGLLKDGKKLTLDEPETESQAFGDSVVIAGKEIRGFTFALGRARTLPPEIIPNARGKRVEVSGRPAQSDQPSLETTLAVEVYDDFPEVAVSTVAFKNTGTSDMQIDRVVAQRHRLNAALADPQASPHAMWSFHGANYDWGFDEVVEVRKGFSRPNLMGAATKRGGGGGVPVVAFWTRSVGEAIGHAETLPLVLSIPAQVAPDGPRGCEGEFEP